MTPQQICNLAEQVQVLCKKDALALMQKNGFGTNDCEALRRMLGITIDIRGKTTKEQREWMFEHYEQNPNTKLQFYADKFGVSRGLITQLFADRGVRSNIKLEQEWTLIQKKKLVLMRKQGRTWNEIAKALNRTLPSVEQKYRQLIRRGEI